VSLQSQNVECVQALQQLGVISQVTGVSAAVINNTTQQSMNTARHCSMKGQEERCWRLLAPRQTSANCRVYACCVQTVIRAGWLLSFLASWHVACHAPLLVIQDAKLRSEPLSEAYAPGV
jgi:hypothetical protein